jgi:hypothetical protein
MIIVQIYNALINITKGMHEASSYPSY